MTNGGEYLEVLAVGGKIKGMMTHQNNNSRNIKTPSRNMKIMIPLYPILQFHKLYWP